MLRYHNTKHIAKDEKATIDGLYTTMMTKFEQLLDRLGGKSFISRFGVTLLESKIKPKLNVAEESRTLIKDKIDHLERLEHDDLDTLTVMIKSLHGKLQKDSKPLYTCPNCGNPSAHEAIFCSNCGKKLGHK